jgi:uncharacterized protein DUF6471
MAQPLDWSERVKRYLKAELKRHDIGYAELASRLKEQGMEETEASVTNKISRGTFTAMFFVASLKAIGCETVHVGHI